uniref:Dehydrogenase/reductase SDR family member 4 n=2 Tax=Parasteatoda tepidariorum TaxID=114398 RepID=A0A2L2Y3S8_PARTP
MLRNLCLKLRVFSIDSNILRNMSHSVLKLSGKVAVVTASTEGIGFSVAKRLATDGAAVVISSRKKDNVEKALDQLKSVSSKIAGIPCHVGKAEDRKRLLEFAKTTFGGVDLLVSNAAVNPTMGHVLDTSEDAWDKIFDINVKSAFLLTQAVLPLMEERGGGSIVYMSSIAGLNPMNILGAYSVSKTALLGLAKAAATQCAQKNIRVNCVCPGIIKTKFSEVMWSNPSSKEVLDQAIPMKRCGEPDEIAGMVSFLCSNDASYITGENFVVAGGYFSRL